MKIASLAALALVAGLSSALAEDVVVISPEQDVVVREYVKKKPLASISVPGVELKIGSNLPDTVELHTFSDMPDMKYNYVVVDNRTVLVDPGTRKIIKVYD